MKIYDDDLGDFMISRRSERWPGQYLGTILPDGQELPAINEEIHIRDEDGVLWRAWVYRIEDRGRGLFMGVRTTFERVE